MLHNKVPENMDIRQCESDSGYTWSAMTDDEHIEIFLDTEGAESSNSSPIPGLPKNAPIKSCESHVFENCLRVETFPELPYMKSEGVPEPKVTGHFRRHVTKAEEANETLRP
jgi:hypothetical protein